MLPKIAITGKMGSGKSTMAQHLVDNYGYTKVSFADRLKEIATKACNMVGKDRELLQRLGVMIREDDPDYWVNAAFRKIRTIEGPVVIDDLRFPNELKACQQHGFNIYRVVRDRDERIKTFGLDPKQKYDFEDHISETALDKVDLAKINSNTDIENYRDTVDQIMQEFVIPVENT